MLEGDLALIDEFFAAPWWARDIDRIFYAVHRLTSGIRFSAAKIRCAPAWYHTILRSMQRMSLCTLTAFEIAIRPMGKRSIDLRVALVLKSKPQQQESPQYSCGQSQRECLGAGFIDHETMLQRWAITGRALLQWAGRKTTQLSPSLTIPAIPVYRYLWSTSRYYAEQSSYPAFSQAQNSKPRRVIVDICLYQKPQGLPPLWPAPWGRGCRGGGVVAMTIEIHVELSDKYNV